MVTIRILQPIKRMAENGETMSFEPGDIEEAYINEKGYAIIDWGFNC